MTDQTKQTDQVAVLVTLAAILPNDHWGWSDLLEDLGPGATPEDQQAAIIELLDEDPISAMENATRQVVIIRGGGVENLTGYSHDQWIELATTDAPPKPGHLYWVALQDGTTDLARAHHTRPGRWWSMQYTDSDGSAFLYMPGRVTHYSPCIMPAPPIKATAQIQPA